MTGKLRLSGLEKQAEAAGFHRFEWVMDHFKEGDKIARSSAPHYDDRVGKDETQDMAADSIKFLKQQGITHVISLNHYADNDKIRKALQQANIAYTPLPTKDFSPPTKEQLQEAWKAFSKYPASSLVYCGYGHGRTGTLISALQIYAESEKSSPGSLTRADYDKNHVEKDTQRQLLDTLQKELRLKGAKAKGPKTSASSNGSDMPPKKKKGRQRN
ncbi:hypothetical protein CDD83_3737 [Cordyceps sp. RAO-2017]|nr:hypothetical protein CDD83_3737 [Cordyceps sp. RAO-2017]